MIGGDGINDESNKTAPAPYKGGTKIRPLQIALFGLSADAFSKFNLSVSIETIINGYLR